MRIKDTISPYNAKASPKMRIRIIPTKILSCWAFARTPASPTIPIDNPAAWIVNLLPVNWIHNKVLMQDVHRLTCQCRCRRLCYRKNTSLDNDDSNDHTIDTQDTCHDDRNHRFHDEIGFEDTHRTDANSCFSWPIGSSEVSEDESWSDSDVSEEVLCTLISCGHVDL